MVFNTISANNNTNNDTSDATALPEEIFKDKTAYIQNGKVTGTFTLEKEIQDQKAKISEIEQLLSTKANNSSDTADATALQDEILKGKTAYIKGGKVIGTFSLDQEILDQENYLNTIEQVLTQKSIPTGKTEYEKTINVTENGITDIYPDSGKVFSKVTVNVKVAGTEYEKILKDLESGNIVNYRTNATKIRAGFLYNATQLQTVEAPEATYIGDNCFEKCQSLVSVSLPKVTEIDTAAFRGCSSLTNLVFPHLTISHSSIFRECPLLKRVEFGNKYELGYKAFQGCSTLDTVIFTGPTVSELWQDNAFLGTKIAAGTGFIYVPKMLLEQYKVSSHWKNIAGQIRAIEDYPGI